MASIQQSMNQLLGAAAGAATAGAYMTRQSDWYKAKQADKAVENINESLALQNNRSMEDLSETEENYLLNTADTAVGLREQALTTAPTAERAALLHRAQTTAQGLKNTIELQRAERTIREVLLGDDLRAGKKDQTLEYQKALETVRDKSKYREGVI